MQIMDMLEQMGGTQSLAREFGVSESQAASGAAALLPALMAGLVGASAIVRVAPPLFASGDNCGSALSVSSGKGTEVPLVVTKLFAPVTVTAASASTRRRPSGR